MRCAWVPATCPYFLGILLALLGVVICIKSLLIQGERIESVNLRALLLVLGAVGVFAGTIESAGIVIATALLVGVGAARPSPESRLREVAVLIVFLLALAVGVFTYALGLPFKLFPV